jgi:GGDEF domain-containing protein
LYGTDVTEVRRLGAMLRAQREVLDQIATNAPIATALDAVARMIEATAPDMTVAVYLRRGEVIELAAAPSVPTSFATAAASVIAPSGVPVPGTIEPVGGALAEAVAATGLGFGWWLTVIDEDGDDLGRIVVLSQDKRFLTADERHQCDEAARLVSVAAGTARSVRRALDAESRDPLTGLLNRRALLRAFEPARADSAIPKPVTPEIFAVVVGVAGLRACNVEAGFDAGDTLLLAVAERLRRVVRARDLLARWSGSRFILVGRELPGSPGGAPRLGAGLDQVPSAAHAMAERVADVAGARVMVCGRTIDPEVVVTVIRPGPGETPSSLLQRLERPPVGQADPAAALGSGGAAPGR